jgi:predicted aspartyl protease
MLTVLTGCAVTHADLGADSAAAPPVEVLLYAESTRPDTLKRIVVPVTLNEQGPFYFLLDTGATRTVINRSVAERLALPLDEQKRVGIRSVSNVIHVPTVIMQSLQVGALQSTQLRMPVLSGTTLDGVDGILGVDLLGDTKVIADFVSDQIRITTANGAPPQKDRRVIAFNQVARRPIMLSTNIGGIPTRAIIDTGCAHTLGNSALLKALLKQSQGQLALRQTEITDATDTTLPAQLAMVPSIIVGSVGVQNLLVSFGEFSVFDTWAINDRPALLIGMDVLSLLGDLTIDYRRKELQLGLVTGSR